MNSMADTRQGIANLTHPFVEEIDVNEIQHLEIVGKGSFGTVYKALWRNIYVAVKYIEQDLERNAFTIEVRQLSKVSHKNIVALYGACTKRPRVCLVMEYAEGGSLYSVLHCNPKPDYTAAHAMSWAKQCAEGVAYLHTMKPKPLIHRDLKPPNLLLVNCGRLLKICDFGTVTDKNTMMTNNKGSAAWMAPEVFEGYTYTEKCDVFSWGIILWEVLSREQPFKNIGYTYRIMWSVHTGLRPPLLDDCPKPIEKLITTCWDPNPNNRPSMEEVVQQMTILCSFFTGADEPLNYNDLEFTDEIEDENNENSLDLTFTEQNSYGSATNKNQQKMTNLISECSRFNINKNKNATQLKSQQPLTSANSEQNNSSIVLNPNGLIRSQHPLGSLSIEVDPHAWDLNTDDSMYSRVDIANSQGQERLSVTETKSTGLPINTANQQSEQLETTDTALDLDSMHQWLDPHLRPVTPDPSNQYSQQIFEQHKNLAQEYLKVQTERAYATKKKENLLAALDPEQRRERLDIAKKIEEREALLQLEASLKRQLQLIRSGTRTSAAND